MTSDQMDAQISRLCGALSEMIELRNRAMRSQLDKGERRSQTGVGLTLDDVAERLNVSTSTARRLVTSGRLRSIQCGPRSRRVLATDLEAFASKGGAL